MTCHSLCKRLLLRRRRKLYRPPVDPLCSRVTFRLFCERRRAWRPWVLLHGGYRCDEAETFGVDELHGARLPFAMLNTNKYRLQGTSACFGNPDSGGMTAAVNRGLFANGTACGTRYRVTCTGTTSNVPRPCTGNSVNVTIVDICVSCSANQFELSREAFAVIANTDAGRINIDYIRI
ncbi:EG45-like domain containing protein 2 [Bidens hawaiensis]|uniref:EG45-like domain containing protein 2 n=1 Tax=Bidens hawaiensis TaxID=980011 RepID=UPI00404B4538